MKTSPPSLLQHFGFKGSTAWMRKHLLCSIACATTPFSALQADTVVTTNTVQNGGMFPVTPPMLFISHSNDPTLTLTNGAGAVWPGSAVVGYLAGESGNLQILAGSGMIPAGTPGTPIGVYAGVLIHQAEAYIGLGTNSSGKVLVSGTNSQLQSFALFNGFYGSGELTVENGGFVSSVVSVLAYAPFASGSALITGPGSRWSVMGQLIVGSSGPGELTVENGGSLSSAQTIVGATNNSSSSVLVTGSNSIWTNTGSLTIGNYGASSNTVTISDQALFKQNSASLSLSVGGGTDNYLRLDGGYFAWQGNNTSNVSGLLSGGFIQVWDGLDWVDADGSFLFDFGYFATDAEALDFTGYNGLGGYTILTTVPEPGTWALLVLGAAVLFLKLRRAIPSS